MRHSLKHWKGICMITDPTWGDNGKGKIVDLLAARADMVIRINGGPNAGHTVINKYGTFKFHLIPSGIFHPTCLCILSQTVVIDPFVLIEEIAAIRKAGFAVAKDNFLIAENAHVIFPWHTVRDGLRETSRGSAKIGTTGRGIGPVYADRTEKTGLQMKDLCGKNFAELFHRELKWQEKLIGLMTGTRNRKNRWDRGGLLTKYRQAAAHLRPLVTDVMPVIHQYRQLGKSILGEAGQGMLLDLDLGTYPYVTSSHPGIAGFNVATAIPPRAVNHVVAVTKAYTTRVGEGPMPTELHNKTGERIQEIGREYGVTTGRPRRCGWLDMPITRYGIDAGGIDTLAVTKIDVFDTFKEIKICTEYRCNGKKYFKSPSANIDFLARVKPVYETFDGWQTDTTNVRTFDKLPKQAKRLLRRIQELAGVPIRIISVGPQRNASIYC